MWHDYRFSQGNKATKKPKSIGACVGVYVCVVREGWSKVEKEVIRQHRESS